jgi:hypothetical protein
MPRNALVISRVQGFLIYFHRLYKLLFMALFNFETGSYLGGQRFLLDGHGHGHRLVKTLGPSGVVLDNFQELNPPTRIKVR